MGMVRGVVSSAVAIPRYRWIQLTILVVLVVAFVTSFQSGSEGARQSGYRAEFSASFPLICDVVAMLATVVHGWARHDATMRRLAALFVMGPMILSWAANAVDHLDNAHVTTLGATLGEKAWTLWVILAAGLCPVAVAALLYFATKFIEFEQRSATDPGDVSHSETAAVTAEIDPEILAAPDTGTLDPVVDTPLAEDAMDNEPATPRRLTAVSPATSPWGPRARELKSRGVPHASAYRQAKREWRQENEVSA